jgi:hypothetical protein
MPESINTQPEIVPPKIEELREALPGSENTHITASWKCPSPGCSSEVAMITMGEPPAFKKS